MDFFLETFSNHIYPLSKEGFQLYKSIFTEKRFLKGDIIAESGNITSNFYIVIEGLVRSFVIDEKAKEHTRSFFTPISSTGPLETLITKEPSMSNYQCLTDCVLLEGDFSKFEKLMKKSHELTTYYSKTLEIVFLIMIKRITELSTLNATEVYKNLIKEIPNINNLIPQYQIASYLNITPVQLSRIRKKLYSK